MKMILSSLNLITESVTKQIQIIYKLIYIKILSHRENTKLNSHYNKKKKEEKEKEVEEDKKEEYYFSIKHKKD